MTKEFAHLHSEGVRFARNVEFEWAPELENIFKELEIYPVWIGGIAIGMMVEPVHTLDMDILISQKDFLILKRNREKYLLVYKGGNSFRFRGTRLDCIVEGENIEGYLAPSPDDIREMDYMPSIEGMFYLKLMAMRNKDKFHLALLYSEQKPDEEKLYNLILDYGYPELWSRYLALKEYWELKI